MKKLTRTKKSIAIVSILSILPCTAAMAAPAGAPDAGSILREQQGNTPFLSEKQVPNIEVGKQKENPPVAVGQKFVVNGFHIIGQDVFSEAKLTTLVQDSIHKELTLGEVQQVADRVTKYFHEQGYIVAKAYIPAQDIKEGVVEMTVVVGKYGKIEIRNQSQLKDKVAAGLLSNLKSGDYVKNEVLEETLLIFNDTPGVNAKATLAPGKEPGTSNLIVEIKDTVRVNGLASLDNWGNRYTGETRLNLNANINNLSGKGDLLSIGGATGGSGMNNYNLSYLLPTGGKGAKFGVGYSEMHYALGQDFASLNASGTAKTTSVFETFTLKRSRQFNLSARIGYDSKQLLDKMDSVPSTSDKHSEAWSIGLSGNSTDQWGGGGINSFGITYTSGKLNLKSADAVTNDSNPQAAGSYQKGNLTFNRVQAVNERVNAYFSFNGQIASKNLDSSEKLQIGGPSGVRAYPVGEALSDAGYIFTSEVRWNMPTTKFQVAAFYDNGKAVLNKTPWSGAGVNNRSLIGGGIGLILNQPNDFTVRLDYAWKIRTSEIATADKDKNGRLWLQATKFF